MANYHVGDIIEANVSGVTNYGIFVNVQDEYTGLIHISEISVHFVKDINDYVSLGENILCEIIEIDNKEKKLKLSIKNIDYKLTPRYGNIKDAEDGFKTLQMNLPVWTREKLNEIKE